MVRPWSAIARDRELLADFLERVVGFLPDPETHPEDLLFARRERGQDLAGLFAQVAVDRGFDRRGGELVLDEVAQRALLLVADRGLE